MNQRRLILILSFLLAGELASLVGHFLPFFREVIFWLLVGGGMFLAWRDFKLFLLLELGELFIGSKGYLFFTEAGGAKLSLRIAWWLVALAVWLSRALIGWFKGKRVRENPSLAFFYSSFFKYYLILGLAILWGLAVGWIRGVSFDNMFFDVNGWLFFALIFPLYAQFYRNDYAKVILRELLVAATIWLSLKTIGLFFIFSQRINFLNSHLYRWAADTGTAEITAGKGNFYRIFFQSHIYVLFAWLAGAFYVATNRISCSFWRLVSVLALFSSAVLISFSRSNWVGLFAAAVFLAVILAGKLGWKRLLVRSLIIGGAGILAVLLIMGIMVLPWPRGQGSSVAATEAIKERVSYQKEESAISSRRALWNALIRQPLIFWLGGAGFGATVTYRSSDPRVLSHSPDGLYTTYAFEWGWLDIWFKLGIGGLLGYLVLLVYLAKTVWQESQEWAVVGVASLLCLAVVNFFSPYLNHPLGIGFLLVATVLSAKSKG